MNVSIRLFARARDLAGEELVEIDLPPKATVGELRQRLGERYPALRPLLAHLFIAINEEYAHDSDPVPPQARMACFPPVSGG